MTPSMENVWLNPEFAGTRPAAAVFADRDGTLIEHVDYLCDPRATRLLPGVKAAVHRLLEAGIPFYILTNQSGVGRGYFAIDRVHACQTRLFELLEIRPDQLAGWCIAPEAPDIPDGYRKPSPRFIYEATHHLHVAAEQTHVIGDTLVDLETAWNANARAWAVACGKPELPAAHQASAINGGRYDLKDDFAACIDAILIENPQH